ncbi:MAG: hypothetical protein N2C14_12085 [Planctomycetales bacterium]
MSPTQDPSANDSDEVPGKGDPSPEPDASENQSSADQPSETSSSKSDDANVESETERRRLSAELGKLRRSAAMLRGKPASAACRSAERLAEMEGEFFQLRHDAEQLDPVHAARLGDPVLDDLRDWRDLCEQLALPEASGQAEDFLRDLVQAETEEWKRGALEDEDASAERCFELLMETTSRELDVLGRRPNDHPTKELLAEIRKTLRERLRSRIERRDPDEESREHWADVLVDRGETTLTGLEELDASLAAERLAVVMDDLHWHLQHVERGRGRRKRRLGSTFGRLRKQWQDRTLQGRLDAKFGAGRVVGFERFVLFLLLLVLGILVAQMFSRPTWAMIGLEIADAAICVVLLTEFFVKFALAPLRWRWFARHFLLEFIPALPLGLVLLAVQAPGVTDVLRAGRLLRFFRAAARYIRVFRPLLRMFRVFGFLIRGLDRLARACKSLLNRNVILYPTHEERAAARRTQTGLAPMLARTRADLDERWKQTLTSAREEDRGRVALARVDALRLAEQQGHAGRALRPESISETAAEEPVEELLERMSVATPRSVEADLSGEVVRRVARLLRMLARPPISWLPHVQAIVPRFSRRTTDAEAVASASRRLGALLKRRHEMWFWTADLYGTVTPSQFVDRIGAMLVKSASRPAYRLLMFSGIYLLVQLLFVLLAVTSTGTPDPAGTSEAAVTLGGLLGEARLPFLLKQVSAFVDGVVGPALFLLGGICMVALGCGFWLKRLAREATDYLERSANSQFLSLTENIRSRNLDRDAKSLYDRVLGPEWRIHATSETIDDRANLEAFIGRMRQSLVGSEMVAEPEASLDAAERILLLYRDALDGALLADSDARINTQLLGNPALRQFLQSSNRVNRKEMKALDQLDLRRQQSPLGGPYLWFNFICRAVAHAVAQLVIDYNRRAVPLDELPLVSAAEKRRYETWLRESSDAPRDPTDAMDETNADQAVTNAFTVMHFLDNLALRDQDVRRRFGPEVLARMQRDRKRLIRRVFGAYPLHEQPKERRVLNLFALYEKRFSGGRILLLPFYLLGNSLRWLGRLLHWLGRCVWQLLDPSSRTGQADAEHADFATAVRKIDRMRAPTVYASIRLRIRFDPEYLGVHVPGLERNAISASDLEDDLRFLTTNPLLTEEIDDARRRAEADMARLADLWENGLLKRIAKRIGVDEDCLQGAETRRAAAAIYLADVQGSRTHLSAQAILQETFAVAADDDPLPIGWVPQVHLWGAFRRFWNQHGIRDRNARKRAWRATVHNVSDCASALKAWNKHRDGVGEEGERILAELLRHPGRVSEQLVTLRSLQTLAIIDVLIYRVHVFELGDYASVGDSPWNLLHWGEENASPDSHAPPASSA